MDFATDTTRAEEAEIGTPADTAPASSRAAALLAAGRPGAARLVIAALLAAQPDDVDLLVLDAQAALAEGRRDDAASRLDHAVAVDPNAVAPRLVRASVALAVADAVSAAIDAAEAVVLAPHSPQAKSLLGRALAVLGRHEDARPCLASAIAAAPRDVPAALALADTLIALNDVAGACGVLERTIAAVPSAADPRRALMLLHVRAGAFARAVALSEEAAQAGAVDAAVLGLRGHALTYLGRAPEADRAYADALALAPEDPYLRHLVASAGHAPPTDRAAPDYVRAVFDSYAPRFDQHLIDLGYRVPGLLRAALLRCLTDEQGALAPMWRGRPWLDLGCGTGLCPVALLDLPLGPATGVDLSPNMLAEARAKGLYAHLIEADLLAALDADNGPLWPLIVSGDTVCYFGDLAPLLDRIARRLEIGGILAFSVERLDDTEQDEVGWRRGARARYSHRPSFVADRVNAAGLVVRAMDEVTIRMEAGAPVPGLLVVAERLA